MFNVDIKTGLTRPQVNWQFSGPHMLISLIHRGGIYNKSAAIKFFRLFNRLPAVDYDRPIKTGAG